MNVHSQAKLKTSVPFCASSVANRQPALIEPSPQGLVSDSINEKTETHEEKTIFDTRNDQFRAVPERDASGSIKF